MESNQLLRMTISVTAIRTGSLTNALYVTDRKLSLPNACVGFEDTDVVAVMASAPIPKEWQTELVLFYLPEFTSHTVLESIYADLQLDPASPYLLAAAAEADPGFEEKYPSCTHWIDPVTGHRCCLMFSMKNNEAYASVHFVDSSCNSMWYAGVQKEVSAN